MPAPPSPRLLADTMLGRLARWLRVLGLDVAYEPRLTDADLVERSRREDRVLLTRDRRLVLRRRAPPYLLVVSERLDEQLLQVVAELRLVIEPERLFGRCLCCNEPLLAASPAAVRHAVPAFVASSQQRFRRCPSCERVYWPASHVRRMRERLARLGLIE